jgi:filamentous hemagglutinin family protein
LQTRVLIVSFVSALFYTQPIAAQVIPDSTLPAGERSQVTGNPDFQIDGGARRGGNLFHSFRQFSVPTNGSAYFNNAADVRTIFARVTGRSISNIDGLIRANGTANLFLLNPNGILFGSNASLNIGGSLIVSTANSINFADNFQYSTTNPQTASLLTVSVPVGLQMGANPGAIVVQGNGYDLPVPSPFSPIIRGSGSTGLQVSAGHTLALIGGDIQLRGSTLTAEQGRIELGSVLGSQVSLGNSFALNYPDGQTFGDIRLSQQALADASGGGVIQVQGNQVSLSDGSLLLIQNQGTQVGGSIIVNAAQSLELSGTNLNARIRSGLNSQTLGVGSGADVAVSTRHLAIQDGANIVALSYSPARTGNITAQVSDLVQVTGFSSLDPSLISNISTSATSSGDAGDVTVSTREITLLNGGQITSSVNGSSDGGDITVNALDAVQVVGQSSFFNPSGLLAAALGSGDAGQLILNTSRLVIQDGGSVSTSTLASGNAGSVFINASESVDVSGQPSTDATPSFVGSSAPVLSEILRQVYGLPDAPSGSSGNVTINTRRLRVTEGGSIDVSNEGRGNAGTLRVNANSIAVDSQGSITAATASGEGGNIDLSVQDFLLLRNNSQITASADGIGNGGNIRIGAGLIVAVPAENSDIRANSVNARGGNVAINASSLFGIQARSQDTLLSDITATGATAALSGAIDVTTAGIDPTAGLVALPTDLVDSSRLIARGCPANEGNSFVISGRGGLPPNPEQQLDDDAHWQDRRRLVVSQQQPDSGRENSRQPLGGEDTQTPRHREFFNSTSDIRQAEFSSPAPVTETTGWQVTSDGEIVLVANSSIPNVQNSLNDPNACPSR